MSTPSNDSFAQNALASVSPGNYPEAYGWSNASYRSYYDSLSPNGWRLQSLTAY